MFRGTPCRLTVLVMHSVKYTLGRWSTHKFNYKGIIYQTYCPVFLIQSVFELDSLIQVIKVGPVHETNWRKGIWKLMMMVDKYLDFTYCTDLQYTVSNRRYNTINYKYTFYMFFWCPKNMGISDELDIVFVMNQHCNT